MKKIAFFAVTILLSTALTAAFAQTGGDVEKLRSELRAVQNQIYDAEYNYKGDLDDIRKASDGKLADLKKEFHQNRARLLDERKAQEKALLDEYNRKMNPLQQKQKEITNALEPKETNNFAKR